MRNVIISRLPIMLICMYLLSISVSSAYAVGNSKPASITMFKNNPKTTTLLLKEEKIIGKDAPGWEGARDLYERVRASIPDRKYPTIMAYRKSPTELWVYDARPEMGIGMHGITNDSLTMAKKLGIRYIRYTMYWNHIENTAAPGVYDKNALAQWDDAVKLAKEQNIELVAVVHGNPPDINWENRYDGYKRFAKFMGDMVKRYPQVKYWELWNEMNVSFTDLFGAGKSTQGYEGGKDYTTMLKIAYPVIKKSNLDALVLFGGLAWDWREFLRGVYESGGRDYFDIMNIHAYGMPINWSFLGQGYVCRHMMRKYGDGEKTLWITEFGADAGSIVSAWGFAHNTGGSDGEYFDNTQLDQWKKCIDDAITSGIYQKYLPYQFAAGNESGPPEMKTNEYALQYLPPGMTISDYGFGIIRSDGKTPRPVYDWLLKEQLNRQILKNPVRVLDVTVDYDGYVPVGYKFRITKNSLVIKNVKVDNGKPVKIRMKKHN
ncbi:MAG: cellulase family glycosylhydrolase [Armatimonadota bacterium]